MTHIRSCSKILLAFFDGANRMRPSSHTANRSWFHWIAWCSFELLVKLMKRNIFAFVDDVNRSGDWNTPMKQEGYRPMRLALFIVFFLIFRWNFTFCPHGFSMRPSCSAWIHSTLAKLACGFADFLVFLFIRLVFLVFLLIRLVFRPSHGQKVCRLRSAAADRSLL